MRLEQSSLQALWSSPWRAIVGDHGVGSVDEVIAGRGPAGLMRTHADLVAGLREARIDEHSCRLLERHGLCPMAIVAIGHFVGTIIISDEAGEQVAAIGVNGGRIRLGDVWDSAQWSTFAHHDHGTLWNLPAMPTTLAVAARGRDIADLLDDNAFTATGSTILGATTDENATTIEVRPAAWLDGTELARRTRE